MKKKNKPVCLLLCIVFALGLTACAGHTEQKTKIAVIAKGTSSDFWQSVKRGVDAAATEYNVSVTFEGPENEEDYRAQNAFIEAAVSNGANAIVLSAIDYEKSSVVMETAAQSGVKIVTIDSAADSPQVSMFIGTDNEAAGLAAAKAATDGFAPESKIYIGLVNYYQSTDNGIKREKGFRNYIDTLSNAEIVAAVNVASNTESASAGAAALLHENPQINVLVGLNEWTTLGVGTAIQNLNLAEQVRGVGFDTNTVSVGMLETGEMDALVVQNPFAIGYLGVQNAAELVAGEGGEKADIYTSVTTVTKNNMFDSEVQKLLFEFYDD